MTNCQDRVNELTHAAEIVLAEDLAAVTKMPERSRIERYNEIKANEQELQWEFSKECPDFLTDGEREHLRGELRLARLLIAASFYAQGNLPASFRGEFIEDELQAVVDFDRYKQFDALSPEQIEERIRRMEGEVYELVTEYTSTQIANIDELIDNPDVQQAVIERLVERYDERRAKIRQGFFVYVETHGIEHLVEAIEDAVRAVADASEERERVQAEFRDELEDLEASLKREFESQSRELKAKLRTVERDLASETVSPDELRSYLAEVSETNTSDVHEHLLTELCDQIEHTSDLEERLDEKIRELEHAREVAANADRKRAREEATEVVERELKRLREQRDKFRVEIERLQRQRDQIESTCGRIDEQRTELEERVKELEASCEGTANVVNSKGLEGENVVTAPIARLLEMDYLGRFDITMHETPTLQLPDREFEVPNDYWDDRSERRSQRPRLSKLLDDAANPNQYPTNQSARYKVTSAQYLGLTRETELVIEAVVFSHLDAHAANGFDAQPADIDDLLEFVNEVVYEAESGEYPYLLAIASPTGWTDHVCREIQADEFARSRYSRYVSVCLVDLQDGSLIFDEADELVRENATLFEPPIDEERILACVDLIRDEYGVDVATDSVLLNEVVEMHGFDAHVVKRAFNRLEQDGIGEQLYLDEYGLALEFE